MIDANFIKTVKGFYAKNNRPMPWRETTDPYKILLSEIMLQQTQVDRVIPKFENFIAHFPSVSDLAKADFKDVLSQWVGLGYNRRALWLHQGAQQIVEKHDAKYPETVQDLILLKGIGHNTAAAVCAYAFNQPVVFIETNIRAVFIHHFFPDRSDVTDAELYPLVQSHVDNQNPREWYWALMDYGVNIKKLHKNPARKSKHHSKQSKFEGSKRQLRGNILKLLLKKPTLSHAIVADELVVDVDTVEDVFRSLIKEGLVVQDARTSQYSLA